VKVLFVVTAFYPEQAIGSIRITKFAKFLQRKGVSVTVISLSPPPWASRDESLYFPGLKEMQWDVIDQSWLFKKVFQKMRIATSGNLPGNAGISKKSSDKTFKVKILASAQFLYTLLKAIDWSICIRKHARSNLSNQNFDFIFASYPSFASPLAGIQLKKLGIGKKLAIDFRDPIIINNTKFSLKKLLQNYILNNADLRSFVSNGVKNQTVKGAILPIDLIAPNGFDSEDEEGFKSNIPKNSSEKILSFVYTGAIYGGKRDLRPFFRAISNVLADSCYELKQLRFEYAGKEGNIFLSQAKEFGMEDNVINHGQISRSDSLLLQQKSDVCLLATWNTKREQGALTGKIFEYFMFKKPVAAIVVGDLDGSEIAQIIRSIGAGFCFEQANSNSYEDFEDWLKKIMNEKFSTGLLQNTYNEKVKNFDIQEVVSLLKIKMEDLTDFKKSL
jgi:glycosyltransferase involved in cell wall biosynthesis